MSGHTRYPNRCCLNRSPVGGHTSSGSLDALALWRRFWAMMRSSWKRLRSCTTSATHRASPPPAFTRWTGPGSCETRKAQTNEWSAWWLTTPVRSWKLRSGLRQELETEFELERPELVDALIFCDMTTTPTGGHTTPAQRLGEIVERYGPDTIVGRFIQRAAPEIYAAAERVKSRLVAAPAGG